MTYQVSVNGKLLPFEEAGLSVFDLTILRGFGVFDFLVTYGERPFLLSEHINRLLRSAELIGLGHPFNESQILQAVTDLLAAHVDGCEKQIRILLSGGIAQDGIGLGGESQLVVMVEPRRFNHPSCYSDGVSCITVEHQREFYGAKTINYLTAVASLNRARNQEIKEVIYHCGGKVREGSTSNVFVVKNGMLLTPCGGILEGITREVVINRLDHNLPVKESGEVLLEQLYEADEVFLSASNKEIMPVVEVDGRKINEGVVGPVYKQISELFGLFTASSGW